MSAVQFGSLDDGMQLYRALGISRSATQDDIKQAYRRQARALHPDKGGTAAAFAAIQNAFETLIDPQARAAYDALAADLRFRPGVAQAQGSSQDVPGATEAALLHQLLHRGAAHPCAVFDPMSQLCVTCEVCLRPATQQCWTCGMHICDFCTRRQHWKGSVSLHWPLVNQPGSMLEQLGRRELELKRREDGQAYKEAQPGYRPQGELQVLRQFQDAVVYILQQQQQELAKTPASSTGQPTHTQAWRSTNATSITTTATSSSSSSSSSRSGPSATHHTGAAMGLGQIRQQQQNHHHHHQQQQQRQHTGSGQHHASPFALPAPTLAQQSVIPADADAAVHSTHAAKPLALHSSSSSSKTLSLHNSSSRKPVNNCWQAWHGASEEVKQSLTGLYDNRLARFYMWTQTDCCVLLAVQLPTGGGKDPPRLKVEPSQHSMTVQHTGHAPVLYRSWSQPIDAAAGVSSWVMSDGQLLLVKAFKAQPERMWTTCFKGDPYLARHLQPPYRLVQLPSELQLEFTVPFWVHPREDVRVEVGQRQLTIAVDGVMALRRTYFWDAAQAAKQGETYKVVDVNSSTWCLIEQGALAATTTGSDCSTNAANHNSGASSSSSNVCGGSGGGGGRQALPVRGGSISRSPKVLSISLALPEATEEEMMYKKGVRQNNASITRSCPHGAGKAGMAFFQDDEDEWGLAAVLQALLFEETGRTWITPKPWEVAAGRHSSSSSSVSGGSGSDGSSGSSSSSSKHVFGSGVGVVADREVGRWVEDEQGLPADVAAHVKRLRAAAKEGKASAAAAAASAALLLAAAGSRDEDGLLEELDAMEE